MYSIYDSHAVVSPEFAMLGDLAYKCTISDLFDVLDTGSAEVRVAAHLRT
jgi:hypothetical protein